MQVNDVPNPEGAAWKVPAFKIRNTGTIAQDAMIKWGTTPYATDAAIASSSRLKGYKIEATPTQVLLSPQAGPGWIHHLGSSQALGLPFITKETPTFIPSNVWDNAALFFIATLPDQPNVNSEPFYFEAQVSWNVPEGGQAKTYRVKAIARNAKQFGTETPKFLAEISFEIQEEH